MPYILIEPNPARRTAHYRVRGTEFGQYIDRSTGAVDRKTAQRILIQWRDEAKENALRGGTQAPATFASAALSYMRAGRERQHLTALLGYFGELPLARIGQSEIDAASVALFPSAGPATRNRKVYTPMSAVMRHAGHVIVLRRPKGGQGARRTIWLEPDDAKRLLEAARAVDERFGTFCLFLLYTGCRFSEATRLKPADLSLDDGIAYVKKTKNGKPRTVHLPAGVVRAITALPRYPRTVFGLSNQHGARRMLEAAYVCAGMEKPAGLAFHLFRHTYGAWMRKFGGLDTSGLVATGAWDSHNAARIYEHAVTSEEARKADLLPMWE